MKPDDLAGRLKWPAYGDPAVTVAGVWACPDPEVADYLNDRFGPGNVPARNATLPGVRALETAAAALGREYEQVVTVPPLPDGAYW